MSASEIAARIDLEALLPEIVKQVNRAAKNYTFRAVLGHVGPVGYDLREALCRRLGIPADMAVGELREQAIREFLQKRVDSL